MHRKTCVNSSVKKGTSFVSEERKFFCAVTSPGGSAVRNYEVKRESTSARVVELQGEYPDLDSHSDNWWRLIETENADAQPRCKTQNSFVRRRIRLANIHL